MATATKAERQVATVEAMLNEFTLAELVAFVSGMLCSNADMHESDEEPELKAKARELAGKADELAELIKAYESEVK